MKGVDGLARGGLANLAGAGFAAVAGFGVAWLVARHLPLADAGVFFAVTGAFVLLSGVARLGTPSGLVYWIARLRGQGRADLVGACLRAGIPPVAAAAALLAVALWLAAPWLGGAIAGPGLDRSAATSLRALAPLLPLAALADTALAVTRGHRLMRPGVILDKLLRPGLQLLGLTAIGTAALGVAVPLPVWPLVWAAPYALVLVLAAYAVYATCGLPSLVPGGRPAKPHGLSRGARLGAGGWRREPGIAAGFWRFTGPRAVASGLQLALQRVDILLVAALAGPAAAAAYAVAGRFVVVGQLASQAIGYAIEPRLAERLGTGDRASAGALYQTATGWLVLATWPGYLLVAVYAPVYLGLFGVQYRAAAAVVAVLAAAMLLATGCGTVDMVLLMAGRTGWNLGNVALALSSMVAIDVVLVPRLGALGAAIGLAAAVAVNNLLPLAQVGYALRIHPFGAGTLTAAGLAAGCFGVLPVLSATIAGTGPAACAATIAVAAALYLAAARRLRRRLTLDALLPRRSMRNPGRYAGV